MNEQNFIFDPKSHIYRLGDVRLISVTESFRLAGLADYRWFTEYGRARGQAVHLAVKYLIEDDLDFSSLDPIIRPYVFAAVDFLKWSKFKPLLSLCERPLYHPSFLYAGTPDLVGVMLGHVALIDIKTGNCDLADMQTAAYSMFPVTFELKPRRYTLKLNDNGTFRLLPHVGTGDFNRFLQGLAKAREVLKGEMT